MNVLIRCLTITTVLSMVLAAATPAAAGEVLTQTVTPAGAAVSKGEFIDESGRIFGFYVEGGNQKIFLYDGTSFTDIVPPGAVSSYSQDANNDLGIIGTYSDGTPKLFHYDNGTYRDLVPPPGEVDLYITGIGDGGHITGSTWNAVDGERGVLLHGATATVIHPAGALSSEALDVNLSGQVVGRQTTAGGTRAFRYSGGSFTDPSPPSLTNTRATGINNAGTIIGSGLDGAETQCFVNQGGTITIISLPDAISVACRNISENNTVIGSAKDSFGWRPFVYRNGTAQYLEAREGGAFFAYDINSSFDLTGVSGSAFILGRSGPQGETATLPPDRYIGPLDGEVILGQLLPAPVVAAGPTFSLTPWAYAGRTAEWWVVAQTPTRTYSYDGAARAWVPGFFPTLTMPLRNVSEIVLPPAGPELGIYTYYFGIDFIANGLVDPKFLVYGSEVVIQR